MNYRDLKGILLCMNEEQLNKEVLVWNARYDYDESGVLATSHEVTAFDTFRDDAGIAHPVLICED